ncbi:hypothetical protein Tco_0316338 [Tanacetum coccineum]
MLEKDMYDSWKSNGVKHDHQATWTNDLESVEKCPLICHSIEENEMTRPKKYSELSATEQFKLIVISRQTYHLQGITTKERECKLYDEFYKFAYKKGETLQEGDDPLIINHLMSIPTAVITHRYPTTNNQLRNSSNPRQQATINDGRITLQPVQGRQISFC